MRGSRGAQRGERAQQNLGTAIASASRNIRSRRTAQRKVRMTRFSRLFVPLSLSGLLAGGIVVACHHSEAPATPRPDPVAPGGQPASGLGPGDHVGNGLGDAGNGAEVDASFSPPPSSSALAPRFPSVRSRDGRAPGVLLAAPPTTPAPGGAPSQGAPSLGTSQPDTSQPGTSPPGTSQPGTSQPGTSQPGPAQRGGSQPGAPLPGSPAPSTPPAPGMGSGSAPSPGLPGSTNAPSDAGISDGYTPPVRPTSDARSASDSQVTPILQRD